MKNVRETAEQIVGALGGKENIVHLTNCMTRLRFTLRNEAKADQEKLRDIDGVRGLAVSGGIFQVIIGTDVDVVCREIRDNFLDEGTGYSEEKGEMEKQTEETAQKKEKGLD